MTKHLRNLCTLLLLAVASIAWAGEETITFSEQGYSNAVEVTTVDGNNFTVTFDKGSNSSNAAKYYTSGTAVRVYGGNTFTVSSGKSITKIVLTFGSSDGSNEITADKETYNNGTWEGQSSSVKFTVGGTSGNRRIAAITVTFEGTSTLVVATPTFTPAAGEVAAGTTVKINVPDDDKVDYVEYSYDQETWTEYDENKPFTITEETTIYARSVDQEGNYSDVVSAKYTIKAETPAVDVVIVEDDKTTFRFDTEGNKWGLPEGSNNKVVAETSYTANGKTIKVAGSDKNGFYYNTKDKYLLIGKEGAYLTLPAFDFEVGKIEVVGKSSASGNVKQNIYVGDEAVSTETTGATETKTYVIAPDYQATGNVYTLKVTSNHNTQITQIIVYKATGDEKEKVDPQLKFSATTATATLGEKFTAPELTYADGFNGTVTYASSDENVATVDAEGNVTLVAAGKTTIKATFVGNDEYKEGSASYTLTVEEKANAGTDKFELVTDASTLAAGDEIIIVNEDATYGLSTTQNNNNRAAKAVKVEEDETIIPSDQIEVITLEGEEGAWNLKVAEGYLYAAGGEKNNYLRTEAAVDDNKNANAKIEITDGVSIITFQVQGNAPHNTLRYNPNGQNPIFSCYAATATTGQALKIYRKVEAAKVIFEDEATAAPADCELANVTYERTLVQGFNTLVLPFEIAADELGENVETIYSYNGCTVTGEGESAVYHLDFQKGVETLTANTPYLVKMKETQTGLSFTGKTINVAEAVVVVNDYFDFVGTYVALAKGNETIVAGDYISVAAGLKKAAGGNKLNAFRAYLKNKTGNTTAQVKVSIDGEEATAIEALEIGKALNGEIFNLQGQQVNRTQRGIYIVNGKKVIVK